MAKRGWGFNPNAGGTKLKPEAQRRVVERINAHARAHYAGKFIRLDIRFRGVLCYIDAFVEPAEPAPALLKLRGETREQYLESLRTHALHLCRLRIYVDENCCSVAFYKYSDEKYEPCLFPTDKWTGTPEEAFDIGAVYLGE